MEVFLTKLVALFLFPLGLALLLMLLGLFAGWRGSRWSFVALLPAFVLLWGGATPFVSSQLLGALEQQNLPRPIETLPTAQAIVVLGSAVDGSDAPRIYADLTDAGDRLLHAARLYRAGKAPLLVAAGGFRAALGESRPEAPRMQGVLVEFGVPEEAMLLESASRNTRENAVHVRRLLTDRGLGRVLLVTSAFHMPRAQAVFEKAGIEVIPAPTDYRAGVGGGFRLFDFLPDAESLFETTLAVKEYLGAWYYGLRGWSA